MKSCIVLNANMEILGTMHWKRAVRLIVKCRSESMTASKKQVQPKKNIPKVIRLFNSISELWKREVRWSKQNVHIRDGHQCQYCGTHINKSRVTVDHVIPQAQGGKNRWDNTVCSCYKCNNAKEDRTPEEANMSLLRKPYRPSVMEFIIYKIKSEGLTKELVELGVYSDAHI